MYWNSHDLLQQEIRLSLMKTEVVLKCIFGEKRKLDLLFNENRSCIEIVVNGLEILEKFRFNENRSCIEIRKEKC